MAILWILSSLALGQSTGRTYALTADLERLVSKEQYDKAEKVFQELLSLGESELTVEAWYHGAVAIYPTGDVGLTRERLAAGLGEHENPKVVEWLWDIDDRYGRVSLACDPKSKLTLHAGFVPYDPEQAQAIAFAQAAVDSDCRFDGMLPVGIYQLYTSPVKVSAAADVTVVDLRGVEIDRKTRKRLEKEWAAGLKELE